MKQRIFKQVILFIATTLVITSSIQALVKTNSNEGGSETSKIEIQPGEKLEFKDEHGGIRNQIILGYKKVEKSEGVYQSVTLSAAVSKNGNRAALIESKGLEYGEGIPVNPHDGPLDTSRIKVIDTDGNVIWEKQLPQFRAVRAQELSDDGKVLATVQHWNNFDVHDKEPLEQLVVYNQAGEEIFVFPEKREQYRVETDIYVSPSGCFVVARASKNNRGTWWIISNIEQKEYRMSDIKKSVRRILDDGTLVFSKTNGIKEELEFKNAIKPTDE